MEQACRAPLNKALCSVLRISLETASDVPALLWSPVVQGLLPFKCPCLPMGRGSTQEPERQFIYFFTVALSKDLGWFARFRIQFLLDHYNDPFLSSVCVCVCVHINVCIYIYIYSYIYIYTYIHMCMCEHLYAYLYIYIYGSACNPPSSPSWSRSCMFAVCWRLCVGYSWHVAST